MSNLKRCSLISKVYITPSGDYLLVPRGYDKDVVEDTSRLSDKDANILEVILREYIDQEMLMKYRPTD